MKRRHRGYENSRKSETMTSISRFFRVFAKLTLSFFAILLLSIIAVNIFAKNTDAAVDQSMLNSLKNILPSLSNEYGTSNSSTGQCWLYSHKDITYASPNGVTSKAASKDSWTEVMTFFPDNTSLIKGLPQVSTGVLWFTQAAIPTTQEQCLSMTSQNPGIDFVWMSNGGTANYYKPGTTTVISTDLYKATTPTTQSSFTEKQCEELGSHASTYIWSSGGVDLSTRQGKGVWKNGNCDVSTLTSSDIESACASFGISTSDCAKYLKHTAESDCKPPRGWLNFDPDAGISQAEAALGLSNTYGCYTLCPSDNSMPLVSDNCSDRPSPALYNDCSVAWTGWIVCQVVTTIAKWVDGMYNAVRNYLTIPVNILTSTQSAANIFLPLANIMLAIVFLIIIYSEATGNGFGAMSNYNIKKTLPRLVIFAILVNISFYICAAAVDLSNIIGSNLDGYLTQADKCQIMPESSSPSNPNNESIGIDTTTQDLAGQAMKQGDNMKDGAKTVPTLCTQSSN